MNRVSVLCSLWGNKYSVDYVNKLYNMVKKNCPMPFDFYCQTDHDGLLPQIERIDFNSELPESTPHEMQASDNYLNGLPRLWDRPKLNYWKPKCWGIDGIKIAFDIDVLILNNLEPIFEQYFAQDKAFTGRSWWHNMEHEALPQWRRRYGARNNGGFYMWQDHQVKGIWDDLIENYKFIYFCFHGGSDNFISTRHLDKFAFVSHEHMYSFNRGVKWPDDLAMWQYRPEKIICVFNTDVGYPLHKDIHNSSEAFPWIKEYWQ